MGIYIVLCYGNILYGHNTLWDHAWPGFSSRPAISLKFYRMCPNDERAMSIECLHLGQS